MNLPFLLPLPNPYKRGRSADLASVAALCVAIVVVALYFI
jgi:hypothetical protein